MELSLEREWDLRGGQPVEDWDPETVAYFDDDTPPTDFPITSIDIPVYSPRLAALMAQERVEGIQLLPLRIRNKVDGSEVTGYQVANYLNVIDCLDRERSYYQVWTKENLRFWEQRPWMLGMFRDVRNSVLTAATIGDARLFRLWGWEAMTVVREDVKAAIEAAGMTGCRFTEVGTS